MDLMQAASRVASSSGCRFRASNSILIWLLDQPWPPAPVPIRRPGAGSEPYPVDSPQVPPCPEAGRVPLVLPVRDPPLGVRALGERDFRTSLVQRVGRLSCVDIDVVGIEAQLGARRTRRNHAVRIRGVKDKIG